MSAADFIASPEQEAIFNWFAHGEGNLVVRARAGTGKTTTILRAIRSARETTGILLCAFNKRIAEELNRKLTHGGAVAKTLHSVGFDLIRRNWSNIRVDDDRKFRLARKAWAAMKRHEGDRRPEYTLMDQAPDQVIGAVVKLASLAKNTNVRATRDDLIELATAYGIQPDNGWADEVDTETLAALAEFAVSEAMDRDGTIDFDDMVALPVYHGWGRPIYTLTVVDEAQDMNATQLALALSVTKGRVVVVGDDRQAIYGFRGADSNAIDRLRAELHATELPLTTTYRCPRAVVALAAQIVPDYTAAPSAPEGTVRSIAEGVMLATVQPADFILSRTNAPLARIALALLRSGKPARIEGRDLSKSLLSLVKRMKCETIPEFTGKLATWAERESAKVMSLRASEQAKQARLDMIADQVATLDALSDGLAEVAELTARIEELFSERGPSIVCSTIHRAKGLEAEHVYLLTDTLYCNGKRLTDEERNIHYVGLTRSKDTLYLVSSREEV